MLANETLNILCVKISYDQLQSIHENVDKCIDNEYCINDQQMREHNHRTNLTWHSLKMIYQFNKDRQRRRNSSCGFSSYYI